MFKVLSLGAGVQSSTLALMADYDVAIFADTGDEPSSVYSWLYTFLIPEIKKQGKRVVITQKGVISDSIKSRISNGSHWSSVPFFVQNANASKGKLHRHCTTDYKIMMIKKAVKAEFGLSSRQRMKEKIEMLIGISTDEVERVKPSRDKWIINRHPLITDFNFSREDCANWLFSNYGRIAPKSSCVFCPYHNNIYWQTMKSYHPEDFSKAVEIDELIRTMPSIRGNCFLHSSLKPLNEVDFKSDVDLDLFGEECEGICGV